MNEHNSHLEIRSLSKAIPEFTLQASFGLGPRDLAALVARSGSGKTTLLRLIAGLDVIDHGEIILGGREIQALPPERRQIGYVFQDQALFPTLNVLENVIFGLKVRGVSKSARNEEGLSWLAKVGMTALASRKVTSLSGGEKQRIAFLRALIWKPALILLDEPFSALDQTARDQARQALLDLHQLWPVPMILVTHDESDVAHLANVRLEIRETENQQIRLVQKISN